MMDGIVSHYLLVKSKNLEIFESLVALGTGVYMASVEDCCPALPPNWEPKPRTFAGQ